MNAKRDESSSPFDVFGEQVSLRFRHESSGCVVEKEALLAHEFKQRHIGR